MDLWVSGPGWKKMLAGRRKDDGVKGGIYGECCVAELLDPDQGGNTLRNEGTSADGVFAGTMFSVRISFKIRGCVR